MNFGHQAKRKNEDVLVRDIWDLKYHTTLAKIDKIISYQIK